MEGESPIKGALKGGVTGAKDKVKEKLGGGGSKGEKGTRSTNIIEEIDIGLPVSVVYNQWTQFQDWSGFMKKVDGIEQEDETKANFKAQVFWSHRRWEAHILEQVPDEKIVWRSKGEKGHVDGAVTFHELAPNLTRVLVVLEYYPQGLFERTGNLWRAQGRRARLELKHFRRHVMTEVIQDPDSVEGWRGVIHEGELERSHDEVVEEEQQEQEQPEDEYDGEDSYDEEEPRTRTRTRARRSLRTSTRARKSLRTSTTARKSPRKSPRTSTRARKSLRTSTPRRSPRRVRPRSTRRSLRTSTRTRKSPRKRKSRRRDAVVAPADRPTRSEGHST